MSKVRAADRGCGPLGVINGSRALPAIDLNICNQQTLPLRIDKSEGDGVGEGAPYLM
jgi:hypothetical protein